MSEVVVVAEIGIVPEKREEALAALRTLCEATHAKDEGCLLYALQLDPADESHVFMVEKWDSAEALAAHGDDRPHQGPRRQRHPLWRADRDRPRARPTSATTS